MAVKRRSLVRKLELLARGKKKIKKISKQPTVIKKLHLIVIALFCVSALLVFCCLCTGGWWVLKWLGIGIIVFVFAFALSVCAVHQWWGFQ